MINNNRWYRINTYPVWYGWPDVSLVISRHSSKRIFNCGVFLQARCFFAIDVIVAQKGTENTDSQLWNHPQVLSFIDPTDAQWKASENWHNFQLSVTSSSYLIDIYISVPFAV